MMMMMMRTTCAWGRRPHCRNTTDHGPTTDGTRTGPTGIGKYVSHANGHGSMNAPCPTYMSHCTECTHTPRPRPRPHPRPRPRPHLRPVLVLVLAVVLVTAAAAAAAARTREGMMLWGPNPAALLHYACKLIPTDKQASNVNKHLKSYDKCKRSRDVGRTGEYCSTRRDSTRRLGGGS